jgi:hypothetical protein
MKNELTVIPIRQNTTAKDCIPACIFMCLKYLHDEYNMVIIKGLDDFPLEYTEIYDLVEYEENRGTEVNSGWCCRLNEKLIDVKFEFRNKGSIKELKNKIKKGIPSIATYKYNKLFPANPSMDDDNHAGVVVGFYSDSIILIDPYFGRRELPINRFVAKLNKDPSIILLNINT